MNYYDVRHCVLKKKRLSFSCPWQVLHYVMTTRLSFFSSIQLPSDLDCINTNFDVIRGLVPELQDINMIVQKLSASEVDLDSDIGPESDARLAIDRICMLGPYLLVTIIATKAYTL